MNEAFHCAKPAILSQQEVQPIKIKSFCKSEAKQCGRPIPSELKVVGEAMARSSKGSRQTCSDLEFVARAGHWGDLQFNPFLTSPALVIMTRVLRFQPPFEVVQAPWGLLKCRPGSLQCLFGRAL